jgi:hypothetical protein
LVLFLRSIVAKFSGDINEVILGGLGVSLSDKLVDPIEAGMIEVIALAGDDPATPGSLH